MSKKTFVYLTGHSKGIGKNICESLFQQDENIFIHGISRTEKWKHERLKTTLMDLSHPDKFNTGIFEKHNDASKIVLVNNAGMLGDMNRVGSLSSDSIQKTVMLNFTSALLLTNDFLKFYKDHPAQKLIVNVSTGVTNYPIDGWSLYCSTKAGLEMFCRVIDKELELDNRKDVKLFSIAPGKIDTDMQGEIRKADPKGFSMVNDFISYKEKGELVSAEETGKRFADLILKPDSRKKLIDHF